MRFIKLDNGQIVKVLPDRVQTKDRRLIFNNEPVDLDVLKSELAGIDDQLLQQQSRDATQEALQQVAIIEVQIQQEVQRLEERRGFLKKTISKIESDIGVK